MRKFHSVIWYIHQAAAAVVNRLRGWHYDHSHRMYRDRSGDLVGGYEETNDERWGPEPFTYAEAVHSKR